MKMFAFALVTACAAGASADILLDQRPSSAANSGFTVGFNGFVVYQPFTVTAADGWNVQRIWLDGFRVTGSGDLKVEIAETDLGAALASTTISMTNTNSALSAFVSGDLSVQLAGNTSYVMRVLAASPGGTWNALYYGASGSPTRSTDGAGNFYQNDLSISTYFEGKAVPTPASLALLSVGGLMGSRRRR